MSIWIPQDVRVHFVNTDIITQTGYESKSKLRQDPENKTIFLLIEMIYLLIFR